MADLQPQSIWLNDDEDHHSIKDDLTSTGLMSSLISATQSASGKDDSTEANDIAKKLISALVNKSIASALVAYLGESPFSMTL